MNAKLTLKLDKNAIKKAKIYARNNNKSLSNLVQQYFTHLSENNETQKGEISSLVQELSGIIKIDRNFDLRKSKTEYLLRKYK